MYNLQAKIKTNPVNPDIVSYLYYYYIYILWLCFVAAESTDIMS